MNTANPRNAASVSNGPALNNVRIIKWALSAAAVLLMGLLGLLLVGYLALNLGVVPLLIGMVIAIVPVPLYLALALWLDRYEKEPVWMLAGAFLWGATVACFFSFVFNTIGGYVVGANLGATAADVYGSVISAPIVEEGSKGLALLILFLWKKDEFDNVIDGVVYAAMVGLGFALTENFLYYGRALAEGGVGSGAIVFVIRGVLSPFIHPIFTSMTGIGLGLARQSGNILAKFAAPLAGLIVAILLHAIWNGSGYVLAGGLGLIFLFFVYTPLLTTAVLAISFFALGREGRVIRQYLTPELQSGLVTRQEYNTLGSVRGRIGSSYRALTSGGFGPWRAHSRFAQSATELAFHRDRVARGITSADAAGREAAYVRLLSELKGSASARYLAE